MISSIADKFRVIRLRDLLANGHKLTLTFSFHVTASWFKLLDQEHYRITMSSCRGVEMTTWGMQEVAARVRVRHWLVTYMSPLHLHLFGGKNPMADLSSYHLHSSLSSNIH
jgi:hypothetical protein